MNTSIYSSLILLNKNNNQHFLKRYVKMVSFYKERNWSYKFGLHEHHILPKSFGGPDTNDNLVFITIREHFILHYLLYKAFPKSGMVNAFHIMCYCSGQKISSKVHEKLKIEFAERQRENTRKNSNKRVAERRHHFLGGEIQGRNSRQRVEDGTHPWQDKEKSSQRAKKRVKEGKNPFSGPGMTRKQLENGTHTSQIKKMCPHCNREFSINIFPRYHGDKCKLKPKI